MAHAPDDDGTTWDDAPAPDSVPAPDDTRTPDSPTDLDTRSWTSVVRTTFREFLHDQCTDLAAALTYYAVLALAPALLAIVSVLGLVGDGEQLVEDLLTTLRDVGPPSTADTLEPILHRLTENSGAGLTFVLSLVLALWSASGYVAAFSRGMNRIYEIDEGRPIWKLRPLLLGITVVLIVIAVLVVVAVVLSGDLARSIGSTIGLSDVTVTVWNIAKWPVVLLLVIAAVAILYHATPNVRQPKVRWLSPGAIVAVVVWLLASLGFGFYVANVGSYESTYGSLAGIIILLLWLWLTNVALLFGAELDAEIERGRQLQSGIEAERTIQLPPRDTRASDKRRAKAEEDVRRGRALRESAAAATVDAGATTPPDADPDHPADPSASPPSSSRVTVKAHGWSASGAPANSQCHGSSGPAPPGPNPVGCTQPNVGACSAIHWYSRVSNCPTPPNPSKSTATPHPWCDVPGVAASDPLAAFRATCSSSVRYVPPTGRSPPCSARNTSLSRASASAASHRSRAWGANDTGHSSSGAIVPSSRNGPDAMASHARWAGGAPTTTPSVAAAAVAASADCSSPVSPTRSNVGCTAPVCGPVRSTTRESRNTSAAARCTSPTAATRADTVGTVGTSADAVRPAEADGGAASVLLTTRRSATARSRSASAGTGVGEIRSGSSPSAAPSAAAATASDSCARRSTCACAWASQRRSSAVAPRALAAPATGAAVSRTWATLAAPPSGARPVTGVAADAAPVASIAVSPRTRVPRAADRTRLAPTPSRAGPARRWRG